jgi:hypothetical protein
MAVLQHNWTGYLAVHAAHTAQSLKLSQPVKGVSTAKAQGRGAWLKCSSHARLRLHANSDEQMCTLLLHVHEHLLLQRRVCDTHIKLAVLPCEQTSLLLLMPRHQVSPKQLMSDRGVPKCCPACSINLVFTMLAIMLPV